MASKTCFHCGSTSGSWVVHDQKDFCCEGCAIVYDILKENSMDSYYSMENSPGIKSSSSAQEAFDYLDEEEIKLSVLDFYDGSIAKIRLYIPAIHCSSCIWLLENLNRLHGGILKSAVNFNKKEIAITYDESQIPLSKVMKLLASLHYKPIIRKEKSEKGAKKSRQLIVKLGVAGFAFGNVMLLSFPDYLASEAGVDQIYLNSFGYISLLLALPVLFYSASDYFLTAWKNLVKKTISIDLPIVVGVMAIFLRSLFEIFSQTGSGYLDSLTGLIFFLLIGKWYQSKTYEALSFDNDYMAYFPLAVTRYTTGGEEETVPVKRLKSGDQILVRSGEIIPADALLVSDNATIDFSFITGESIPVNKSAKEMVYAGGKLLGSSIVLEVIKEVETSYLAQLWKERSQKESTFVSVTLDKVSRYFTWVILSIGVLVAIYWLFLDPSKVLFAFTSILIVACPCALALSVPFAFGHAQKIMGRKSFYLRSSNVVEELTHIDTIVFDKTGTLTDSSIFNVSYEGDENLFVAVKSLVKHSLHPLSRAIYEFLNDVELQPIELYEEEVGLGLSGVVNGANIKIGSALYVGQNASSDEAAKVWVSVDGEIGGVFTIKNEYRKGWEKLLTDLNKRYEVHIISGDNESERANLEKVIGSKERIHFHQSPFQKLEYIQELYRRGHKVLMIGDGLNDAGALKESAVGISVADDVYQFSPASDAIINGGFLSQLNMYLRFSKDSMRIVYASFILSFIYNIVGISYAAMGELEPIVAAILMPLSSVTIVAFTSFLTMARASALFVKK